MTEPYVIGIDGGGTRTTVALADAHGELLRRTGPPGLVDPRNPAASADVLVALIREARAEAGVDGPAAALCAGLAGVGNAAEREVVRASLAAQDVARRVVVVGDGETALEGAFAGGAGILVIAGTGSIAYGRSEDGHVERCGGWGMIVGDEGSAYGTGRAALVAALRAHDGRDPDSRLLPAVLDELGLRSPDEIPPWAGRAEKTEIAALAPLVARVAAEGDDRAEQLVATTAQELARLVAALVERLGPWTNAPTVVYFGGMFRTPGFARRVDDAIAQAVPGGVRRREAAEDAVGGALRMAWALAEGVTPSPGA
ncbi:MAG: BadF/BadG/BcrA/BcrD ATPase family protein [Rhodothermales bacterium]